MAERISRRYIPVKAKVAAILALAPAAFWAACGGGGNNGEVNGTETGTPFGTATASGTMRPPEATPSATATETPTNTPTPELTPEPIPSPQRVLDLISQGLAGTPVTPYQVPAADDRDLDIISDNLAQCNKGNQPVAPFRNVGDMQTFTSDDPTYSYKVELLCQKIGRATKTLYEVTKNENFFQANRLWEPIHKDVFYFLMQEYKTLTPAQWESTVGRYYSFSK